LINNRRTGGGSLYVKGHLLNENLDGPGNNWANLTPLTQQANSDHKTQFENPVKLAVNNATSGYANKPHGYAKNFIVKAMYNREINAGLISQLENEDVENEQIPNMPDNTDPIMLAKILRAEQFVPKGLECSVVIGEKEGNKPPKERTLSKPIDNEINHGDLSKYQLSPEPRTAFDLKEKISGGREASIKHLMTLKLIGRVKAEKLHDKMVESGSVPNFISLIGITKKKLEMANKGYKIINRRG
jgi:hypothetical protein